MATLFVFSFVKDSHGHNIGNNSSLFSCKADGEKKISKQITLHIKTKGEINLVCWTMEYERPNENVPELINLLNFIVGMAKAIDDHHVKMN
ncbi:hypothetical protein H5410_044120 [Solanum commersonii]|uniref:Bet v I/Major latex protein domain-containing protein n=1 Tax=Solanum commersonii TaxID=4109 RepID=A0A9J5X8V0_SOLCO|nr:hypothetical protein H5410_044120 [Solanum commersonii]